MRAIAPGLTRFVDGCDRAGFNLAGFNLLNIDMCCSEPSPTGASLIFSVAGRKVVDACRIFHRREPHDLTAALKFYCGLDHERAQGAAADVLATLAVLDAQVGRYDDLPRTVDGLHGECNDSNALDMSGMFWTGEDGAVVFLKGKYLGRAMDEIAWNKPDYLEWMLREDYFDDTKTMVSAALRQAS